MVKHLVRLAVVLGLVALGWSAGRAQTTAPDFELAVIRYPGGADMQVECVRGCKLQDRMPGRTGAPPIDVSKARKDVGWACKVEAQCNIPIVGWVQR